MSSSASQRRKPGTAPDKPETGGLTLRLFDGMHVGAERALADGETVVIGCGDDCDVILSDAGVAVHHCYLGVRDGVMSLRAMDAPAKVDGETLRPGDPHVLAPFAMVSLGNASFAAGPRWSEQWRDMARIGSSAGGAVVQRSASLRWAAWLLGLGVLAILVGWYWSERPAQTMTPAETRVQLTKIVHDLKLDGVSIGRVDKRGSLLVTGVVGKPESVAALRAALVKDGLDGVRLAVRDGPSIAADMQELLRNADPPVAATTRWLGGTHNTILVSGHFGDGGALKHAMASNSIQALNQDYNLSVSQQNLDNLQPDFGTVPDGKQIVTVVEGGDAPYLITTDHSRYYVGGTLPGGGVFEGLDGGQLLVRDQSGGTRRFDLSKVAPGASIVDNQVEVQDERK